jgi:hypothetical protein
MLAERGYDVIGTLEDLRPDPVAEAAPFRDPDKPREKLVADAAVDAVVALLQEVVRLQEAEHRMRGERDAAVAELDRSRGLWFRFKHRMVRAADHNRLLAGGLAVYRSIRGRISRSA